MNIYIILNSSLLLVVSWVTWAVFRVYSVKSPLDNIPGPSSQSWISGNLQQFFAKQAWKFHGDILKSFGDVIKINGIFGDKRLYISDPLALYYVLLKDQNSYDETTLFTSLNQLSFGAGLMGSLGEQHRKQRKMLNPVFSVNHMRQMTPIFYRISHKLRNVLVSKVSNGPAETDILEWMTRTALELIGQGGLGYSFDPIDEGTESPRVAAIKSFFPAISTFLYSLSALPYLVKIGSPRFRRALVDLMPWKSTRRVRHIVDTLEIMAKEVLESKRNALNLGDSEIIHQVGEGKDIMSILLRANMDADENDRLSDSELLGQVAGLIFAGMDTTSTALGRTLHVLSQHPDAQAKLRAEIREAQQHSDGDIEYDELVALPYLDAVCRETLRLYSPVPYLSRTTQKDTILPLAKPIRGVNGEEITSIAIPKNHDIILGILATNRNPSIWGDDALEWKPERWLSPLPESVTNAKIPGVYSHLMTFLGGSRACIGFKFSQLEMKVVLALLVETLRFDPTSQEIEWNMGQGIITPSIAGNDGFKPELPLKLSLARTD